jgi:hypothetical protein
MVDQPADVSRNAMPGRKSSDGEVTGDRPREASSGARATGDRSVSGDSTSGAGMTGDGSADTSSGDSTSGAEASGDGSADASSGASTSGAGVTGDRQADAAPGDSTASTSSEVGPGVRLFAALAGEAPEDVTDPEVFIRALRRLGDGAVEVAQQALRGEEGKAAARARLRALADTFREHGIPIPRGDSETAESTSPAGSAPHTSSS